MKRETSATASEYLYILLNRACYIASTRDTAKGALKVYGHLSNKMMQYRLAGLHEEQNKKKGLIFSLCWSKSIICSGMFFSYHGSYIISTSV